MAKKGYGIGKELDVRRRVKKLSIEGSTTGNKILTYLQNPEDKDCVIDRIMVDVAVASQSANTFDIGVAADATTASGNLINSPAGMASTVGVYDNIEDKGTNGKARQKWNKAGGANNFITVKIVTDNDNSNLRATLYVFYLIQD